MIPDDLNTNNLNGENPELEKGELAKTIHLSDMYEGWFLDYASYVILERAVPEVTDGLKPVQRRILHAMKELDDGRYNKVANIIGHTMKYHPHGDASIGDALVQLGQKDLLIDTQGNWGNILTGDSAAAPRYIEARLSKFALEILFNAKTTVWKSSYDGRNKEPVTLPAKFPLLLAQGVEGIAVGLSSKILPHNFNELIDASIKILQGKEFDIFPDFLTGGLVDVSRYNDGNRGGKIRLRAKISQLDKKTLVVNEIPYGTTTGSIIDSILNANEKGKIKIRKIDDNTAQNVEILIHLTPGVSPDTTMDALFAFTECEVSISPNACVIEKGKPRFLGVSDILKISTEKTLALLKKELEIRIEELKELLHFSSLEKLFIEKEIYEGIKKCRTDEEIDSAILKGFKPYVMMLIQPIAQEDIKKLRKIPIDRISKFNSNKADESIRAIKAEMDEVENHLANLIDFAIEYFRQIRKKYGKNRDRKTEIRNFDTIEAVKVAAATQKLYVNREEGFAGTGLKKDEFVSDCSDIDDIITFRANGTFLVTKVTEKVFVGQDIIHISVFQRNDERTVYNMIYRDGKNGKVMVKRFSVVGVTRDKEYSITKGTPDSKVLYFTANPNGEAEIVKVELRPKPRIKKLSFDFDFSTVAIKGRGTQGNILTKFSVKKIEQRQEGVSTLASRMIWYDDTVKRLNSEERGFLLGDFSGSDRILTVMQSGYYRLTSFDLSTHFDDDMIHIEKFDPEKVMTVIYQDFKTKFYFLKRFKIEATDRKIDFIGDEDKNKLILFSVDRFPRIEIQFDMKLKTKGAEQQEIIVHEFIGEKSYKAKGKRLTIHPVKKINPLEPLQFEELLVKPPDKAVKEEEPLITQVIEPVKSEPETIEKKAPLQEEKPIGEKQKIIEKESNTIIKNKPERKSRIKPAQPEEPATEQQRPDDSPDSLQMELPL